jgi:hypothetical protein
MQCFAFLSRVWQAALASVKYFGCHCIIFFALNPWHAACIKDCEQQCSNFGRFVIVILGIGATPSMPGLNLILLANQALTIL